VLALNAAKCSFHEGGLRFAHADTVRSRLNQIAETILAERADVVCLSEVVMECGPAPLDQVEHLARACGFAHWASAENYSFGLPFYRIRSGNAVLSRVPLRALPAMQLAGGRPFWNPTNNRRALWFELAVNGTWLLGASIRDDSFDLQNNARQARQILDFVGTRPALLAGDFNAEPGTEPMKLFTATQQFVGFADGPPTYPAHAPARRIDQILGPAGWTVTDSRVVDTGVSDHLAVVVTFALPGVARQH
jgi:endonuclease/exonuclease/phosphatase family metal-dependent hydrolase